ncbi:hypothetical protein QF049_003412 [Paenibacillus sp. W4I10]|nr:hypothetical protein [Paenibacillus sp. W4I10]
MRKHSGVVLNEQEGSQQEWYREGEQPVVSCILHEVAGFFDFQNKDE